MGAGGYDISAAIDPTGGTAGGAFNTPFTINFGSGSIYNPFSPTQTQEEAPVASATEGGGSSEAAGGLGAGGIGAASTSGTSSNLVGDLVLVGVALAVVLVIMQARKNQSSA